MLVYVCVSDLEPFIIWEKKVSLQKFREFSWVFNINIIFCINMGRLVKEDIIKQNSLVSVAWKLCLSADRMANNTE